MALAGCDAGPFDGDTISDTTQSFSFVSPESGYYFAGALNVRTNAYDLSLGLNTLNATGTPNWTDCAARNSEGWYAGAISATIPNAQSVSGGCSTPQCVPWEYFAPGTTSSTNSISVQLDGLSANLSSSFLLSNFSDTPHPGQSLSQCLSQYQCSTDMITNCSTGKDHLTLQTPCGASGQHCCTTSNQTAGCPGDSAASCDWDLVCREGLWSSALATTDAYARNSNEDWNYMLQGVATDGTYWYITQGGEGNGADWQRGTLFKVPMAGWDFAATDSNNNPSGTVGIARNDNPQFTSQEFCWHWGDPEVFAGQVYVPEENCNAANGSGPDGGPNRIGLFDASKLNTTTGATGSFIGSFQFTASTLGRHCAPDPTKPRSSAFPHGSADCSAGVQSPSVAVHPKTGEIYIAGPQVNSVAYSVYVLRPTSPAPLALSTLQTLQLVRVLPLDGNPPWAAQANSVASGTVPAGAAPIGYCSYWSNYASNGHNCGVQGLAFSPSGEKLYVVDQNMSPTAMANTVGKINLDPFNVFVQGGEYGWIHVYQVAPDHLTWEKDYPLAVDYSDHQETEGIAILNAAVPPSNTSTSQVHVEVYKNEDANGSHEFWSHHYAVSGGPF